MNLTSEIILQTYELADMINASGELHDYLQSKKILAKDQKVVELKKRLAKEKERLEEVERFGHYHPNYHLEKDNLDKTLQEINQNETVKQFRKAEEKVNDLLFLVSITLARSISDSIIVPKDDDIIGEHICSSGGCSSCGVRDSCPV